MTPLPWRHPRTALALLALALAGATCAPPLQSGGVEVAAGAGERFGMLCKWRRAGEQSGDVCPGAPPAAPARVRRIEAARDALAGPLAIGRRGDYVLENDQIVVVVDQLGPGTGFAESGGNVVDAADARARRDELGQVFTYFGVFPRQALYEDLSTGVDPDGAAWIEVRGRELREPALAVTTRYALRPGDRALLLTTALENRGDRPIEGLDLGDAVQWGAAEKVAPGKEPGFRGDYAGPFVAGVGASVAYALVPASGDPIHAKNGGAWSNVSFVQGVALPPGGRAEYARVLAVAPRGDPLGVATELLYLGGGAPGGVEVAFTDARGAAIPPVAGRLLLSPAGGAAAAIPLWMRLGEAAPGEPAGGEVPPGRYDVRFEGAGRRAVQAAAIEVRPGEVTPVRLALTEAGRLALTVREAGGPTPAKIGLFDAATGSPLSRPLFTLAGDLAIPAVPGRIRVVASRGPEFSLAEATVEVRAGETTDVALALARVVDTSGYVGCDLHQHTALSADAGVAVAKRVVSNVVEGVECAVASEHNLVADLTPVVAELGLAARFRSIGGNELTSDASRQPFGHVNVFPLEPDAARPRGGAQRVRDRAATEVFDEVRALPGERVIQVNHPRSPSNGWFELLGFDPATGLGTKPGYDARFDAIEVWSGRYVAGRARTLEDYWALLRAARPATPTANTDTHGTAGSEPGYPRTYVAVPDDDPARLAPAALVQTLRHGRDVVLTNGPFVTMRLGDVRPGGLLVAPASGPAASPARALVIRVERAPWVDASEVSLWIGGAAAVSIPLPGATRTPAGAVADEITVPLVVGRGAAPPRRGAQAGPAPIRIADDTFVAAVVTGRRPLEPVLAGDPQEILPFAMTSPIWIDADGDGKALGR